MKRLVYIVSLMAALVVVMGCSTEKNTLLTRSFHNLTARYNVYFNGNQSFMEGREKIQEELDDDYTALLPVFKSSLEQAPARVEADMDKAIKKSVKLVKTHSITVKPKRKKDSWWMVIPPLGQWSETRRKELREKEEYCNWVDDAYLLMGKAHLYKHDFTGAVSSLKIIERNYKTSELIPRAQIWIARAYTELENYDQANIYFDKIEDPKALDRQARKHFFLARADWHIRQSNWQQGTAYINKALDNIREKREKARYSYILAQLYQRMGQQQQAVAYYGQVVEQNPPYDMAFNAKINQAVAFHGGSDGESIKEDLLDMLKDEKNNDYLDRIYYALANIELKAGNREQATNYFQQAAKHSSQGNNQRALIYLALGDLFFEQKAYEPAAAYYDSTMNFLSQDMADYDEIVNKATHLTRLVSNLKVVQRQDSLQQVAQMPERERNQLINGIIDEVKRREAEQKMQQQQGMQPNEFNDPYASNDRRRPGQGQTGTTFYFYNQTIVSRGMVEFERKWGNRKLEDHWRRANKQVTAMAGDQQGEAIGPKEGDNKTLEYYLQDLPLTDSAKTASDNQIIEALYNAGLIYFEQIEDYQQARNMFEQLVRRFPDSRYRLEAWYQLYQIARFDENSGEANRYKNQIISNYPNSHYAKILSDPDYLKTIEAEQEQVQALYDQAFKAYSQGRAGQALVLCEQSVTNYPDNALASKFALLKAFAFAELGQINQYTQALETLIADYPQSQESEVAKQRLNALSQARQRLAEEQKEIYQTPEGAHQVVLVFNNQSVDAAQLRFDILSFNLDYYDKQELEIELTDFFDGRKALWIKSLNDKYLASRYIRELKENADQYLSKVATYDLFIITPGNWDILAKDQNLDKYMRFLNENYTL